MNQDFNEPYLKKYTNWELIGQGTYGWVYRVKQRKGGFCAIKKSKMDIEVEGLHSTSVRQIAFLSEIDHPNVVKLKDVLIQKFLYLVFQYLDLNLSQYIKSHECIEPSKTKKIVFQILSGIAYCHQNRIVHRDLTTSNILIDKQGNVKIGDFGLARSFGLAEKLLTPDMVSLHYRAPEILLGSQQYSASSDIWSVGCIFGEMVIKKTLFKGDNNYDQLNRIFMVFGTPNENVWPGVSKLSRYKSTFPNYNERVQIETILNGNLSQSGANLLKSMLTYDPKKRITAKNALKHPYFQQLKQ